MPFIHNPIDLPNLERYPINGVRYYKVPYGDTLHTLVSVTSVTSHWKADFFRKWRAKVGEEEANRITNRATTRGTDMHLLTEHYLRNETLPKAKVPIADLLFKISKPELDKINNIIVQEQAMYSLKLGIAGTPDCIADYNGELSIIDFKTSAKPKPREWIEDYFVQCAAYACMLYEMKGIMVKKFFIIMTCEDGECVVYEERDKKKYINLLSDYNREFVESKLQEYA